MSVEGDIVTALSGLAPGRVYADLAPVLVARPYIVYQQVGGEAPVFLERAVPSKKNGRFQVSVWADKRLDAATVAVQIESAMVQASAFQAKPLGAPIAVYDEETELRGSSQDFTVWSDR